MSTGFTAANVPDMTGKTALVTGANTGLGFEAANVLAGKGARVLLGCRTREKADAAVARIRDAHASADVDVVDLDQADLASVRAAAEQVKSEKRLDLLINNAGIMLTPFGKTVDGFESQFGVNHLGTFALTGLLLDKLEDVDGARVVNTSSNGHKVGKVDWDDLQAEKGYGGMRQYALSKLANLLHAYELERRLRKAGRKTIAVAVHPGGADTDLARHMPKLAQAVIPILARPFLNDAAAGAWPTLMGATAADVVGGEYFGPRGFTQIAGPAVRVKSNALSYDEALAEKMWQVSIELTGVDPGI